MVLLQLQLQDACAALQDVGQGYRCLVCSTTGKRVGDMKPDQGIFDSCPFHRSEAEEL
jgi:hypothetical protein